MRFVGRPLYRIEFLPEQTLSKTPMLRSISCKKKYTGLAPLRRQLFTPKDYPSRTISYMRKYFVFVRSLPLYLEEELNTL